MKKFQESQDLVSRTTAALVSLNQKLQTLSIPSNTKPEVLLKVVNNILNLYPNPVQVVSIHTGNGVHCRLEAHQNPDSKLTKEWCEAIESLVRDFTLFSSLLKGALLGYHAGHSAGYELGYKEGRDKEAEDFRRGCQLPPFFMGMRPR